MEQNSIPLMVVGLNHRSAPLAIRERLSVPREEVERSLQRIKGRGVVASCMLLNTCNRVEYYLAGESESGLWQALQEHLALDRQLPCELYREHLYRRQGAEALRHLFRVAASVDSLVVGEPQILGQVKEAYFQAVRAGTNDRWLDRVLHRTFTVAKKVRSDTEIGRQAQSVPGVAVELARRIFGALVEKRCLVIGGGEMAEQVVRSLRGEGIKDLFIANRTLEGSLALARHYGGTALPLHKAGEYLDYVDIVIASSAAPHFLLGRAEVAAAMRRRKQRSLFFIDIAVPRNLDPAMRDLEQVFLYDLDDLQAVVEGHRQEREAQAQAAEEIIERELAAFLRALAPGSGSAVIKLLGEKAEAIRQAELARTLTSLRLDEREASLLEQMTRAIVKRLIHDPIQFIKSECQREEGANARELVERLFRLEMIPPDAGASAPSDPAPKKEETDAAAGDSPRYPR